MKALIDRVAVVTGAGQGNGKAIALGLAQQGAAVAVVDANADQGQTVADMIVEAGGRARAFGLDVRDEGKVLGLADQVEDALGLASILVNNAGVFIRGTVTDEEGTDRLRKTLDVNVVGTALMVRSFIEHLRRTKGCVINIGSSSSFIAAPNAQAYAASKGAVKQLTAALAVDLGKEGIRVNALAPGFINTPMTEATQKNDEFMAGYLRRVPLGRIGEGSDLVGPIVFLASAASSYITGVTLPVDGGFLAA